MSKLYKEYLESKYTKTTIKEHLRELKVFLNWLAKENIEVAQTSYNDVLSYVNHLQKKKVKPQSINNRIRSIRIYFSYLKITPNPTKGITIKSSRKNIITNKVTEEELNQLYKDFVQDKGDKRFPEAKLKFNVVLGLMIYQGCTATELKRIHLDDISLVEGTLRLVETDRTKQRIITLEATQILPLVNYLNSLKTEHLFTENIHNLTGRITKKIGVSNRLIRDSRILIWLTYYNISKVQYLCGFKYISSLQKYRESQVEDLRMEMEKVIRI